MALQVNLSEKRTDTIPFGKGTIRHIDLGPSMNMMIHQYELTTDVQAKRAAIPSKGDFITFSFRNVFLQDATQLPSVQVSSGDIDLDMFFPAKSKINAIIISIHIDLLKDLIPHNTVQTYLYEEILSPAIQDIANEILTNDVAKELLNFHYKLKAQALIFFFFTELLKRKKIVHYPLNNNDVKMIYQIRDKIMGDLTITPNIPELAHYSGMSESKMNRLFKQIFGHPIYNYHQKLRINKAAYLIKHENLSVSEAGYQLGFTNMSHFTRIFERHIGLKPKRYSKNI